MRLHPKRWLYLTHRWLGIALCAFFAMWFVSGMVMMYVGYPKLTPAERLQHLPVLAAAAPLLAPAQALERAGVTGPLKDLRLAAASGGVPVYFATPQGARANRVVVIDALRGERLPPVDAAWALAGAAAYAGSAQGLQYLGSVAEDAFTHSRGLDAHRPLHRVQLADADHTWLYVSGQTGEVVRDATRTERVWNYAGAWLHWLYPFRGNAFNAYWSDIVNGLSIAGIAVALAGTIIGLLRWRFTRPYRSGARSPYPARMMRWHHVTGLLFALVTITWIFSGLMSMNPWRIFDSGAAPLQTQALQGSALAFGAQDATPQALIGAAGSPVRELRWQPVLGRTTVFAQAGSGAPRLLDARTAQPLALDARALRAAAAGLLPAPVARIETLTDYDLYYYARAPHSMMGGSERPLPIWRVVFDDAHASWVHLDPLTGSVLGRLDSHRRASRWLFAMLHSWDWLPLLERRPLWDITLLVLSLGGLALSASGMVIGWKRLRRRRA
ncbi:MAG: PepSY domain-containing protein [Comamonas sp.]